MSATRCIFKSKVYKLDNVSVPPPPRGTEGKICLMIHYYEEKRFWHDDDIANFRSDGVRSVYGFARWVLLEHLTEASPMSARTSARFLDISIPIHEQPTIFQKVMEVADSNPGEPIPIVAIVLNVHVCSSGTLDYQDIVDSVSREPVDINLAPNEVIPQERTRRRYEYSEAELNRILGPTPITRSNIEGSLKGLKLDSLEEDVIRENPTCPICIQDFAEERGGGDSDKLITSLPNCGHYFHFECVIEWLMKQLSCPSCRSQYVIPTSTSAEMEEKQEDEPSSMST